MQEPTKEQIKSRAKVLREILLEKYNVDMQHGHALEVISQVFGYKNWNTFSADLNNEKTGKQDDSKIGN